MEIWHAVILLIVGVFSGFLNVMAGGGSLLMVPVMVFLGMPGPVANGTNRIAILAQNVTATIAFFKKGFSDFKLSITLSLCAVPGAILGAMFGTQLEGVWFNRTLAMIMLCVIIYMFFENRMPQKNAGDKGKARRLVLGHVLMVGIGLYGGFIQIGAGLLLFPVLHHVMGLDLVRVNMHKVFIIGTYTIAALLVFASRVEVLWVMGICLAVGTSIGAWLGAHVSVSKGEGLIKIMLNSVLIVFVIKLLFFP